MWLTDNTDRICQAYKELMQWKASAYLTTFYDELCLGNSDIMTVSRSL